MTPQPRRDPVKKVIGGSNRHTGSLDDAGWRPLREGFLDVGPCGERQGAGIVEFFNPSPGWFMVHGQLGSYDVERRQERRTVEPGERMVLITPDAGALVVWRRFTEP